MTNAQAFRQTIRTVLTVLLMLWGGTVCYSPFFLKFPDGMPYFIASMVSAPFFIFATLRFDGWLMEGKK